MPAAVVFDLDGVLIDSEPVWDAARREIAEREGGTWVPEATERMMGMSSTEWSRYMHTELRVPPAPAEISAAVVESMLARYQRSLPLIPGAREAVERLAMRWPLGLASSANRPLIELVLREAGLAERFAATVSAEEVPRGKPAPDVYLEAARQLATDPARCVAVEDSPNGIRSAAAAGMAVVAIPRPAGPVDGDALAQAASVLQSIEELDVPLVEALA
jgi:HAD superfamily hydrolase (TIGR01509 family)